MSEQSRKDGQPYARVILQRIYRDEHGKFHGTSSFRSSDIPLAILVLGKAYARISNPMSVPMEPISPCV